MRLARFCERRIIRERNCNVRGSSLSKRRFAVRQVRTKVGELIVVRAANGVLGVGFVRGIERGDLQLALARVKIGDADERRVLEQTDARAQRLGVITNQPATKQTKLVRL